MGLGDGEEVAADRERQNRKEREERLERGSS